VCTDIALPGQSLGSKLAGPTTYLPGTCQPLGGDASGGVTKGSRINNGSRRM
jgi:hypothetical protein